jgi:hypothetical protein
VVREAGQILTQLTAVMFKQLLQAGSIDVCQIDACRLGGVNEVMAVLLMAKKFGIPVVPHSGGVGLVCPFPCSNAPGRSHANQVSLFYRPNTPNSSPQSTTLLSAGSAAY